MPGIFIPEFDTKFPNDFVLDDFLQPLENSRAAREFSGNLPENSFTGSGHWIKNPDSAMKLVGIPGVSRTYTSHRPCASWKLSAVLLIV